MISCYIKHHFTEVVALYDYLSDVEGDLHFVTGEVISVTEDLGEWYRGNIGSRAGLFPGNFVQEREQNVRITKIESRRYIVKSL